MELIQTDPVICIDPGTTESGMIIFNGRHVFRPTIAENEELLAFIKRYRGANHLVIEGVASYGMPVGVSTFETVEWIGRFREAFGFERTTRIFRKDVKMFLCGNMRAKDAHIRQRIIDIFPPTGGGANPQIGIKRQPGPLYGVTSHAMSALALGMTYKYGAIVSE